MATQDTTASGFDQAAWDLATRFSLRPELYFDAVASVRPTKQAHPGSSVSFLITSDIAAQTTELTEGSDVTPVSFSDSSVTITLKEYGAAIKTTAKLRGSSIIPVDPVVANLVGYSAGVSMDSLAKDILVAGTNVFYSGDATTQGGVGTGLTATDTLSAANVRKAVAQLRKANVQTLMGAYVGYVNPDVSVDLRTETGAAAWVEPMNYSSVENRLNGEIGKFEGVRFVETPRLEALTDAGDGAVDAYQSLIVGHEALAKVFAAPVSGDLPSVRPTPVTDALWRFVGMGWYWMGNYGILRQEAVRRIESASSLGSN